MSPAVFLLVATAALLHAAWNILLKSGGDPLRTSGRLLAASAAVYLPVAVAAWLIVGRPAIPAAALLLGVVSAVLEAAYFILLSAAYRRGDLSIVYPIARGSAPLFAVVAGVALLGERLGTAGWLGVAALLGAILVLQRPWANHQDASRAAVWFALATGLTIAAYSAVDRVAARLVAPWIFAMIVYPLSAAILVSWIRFVDSPRTRMREPVAPAPWGRATVTGLLSLGAYLLILVAYTLAPLVVVAPLRESAVVLVAGWGSLRLRESGGGSSVAARLVAACLVVAGVGLLAIG